MKTIKRAFTKNVSKLYASSLLACMLMASGCSSIPNKATPELEVVPYVDLERYLGKWYEIALYPNWFEEGCFASTAFYEKMASGKIRVVNRCRKDGPQGELKEAIGIAEIADTQSNAKLKVQFFWPFTGDYWIIDIDDDYQHVIVSEPKRQYLWILSRSPQMEPETLARLKSKIAEKGFDLSYLENTKY
jgi:apolipoprotein D and lipocalin family protein